METIQLWDVDVDVLGHMKSMAMLSFKSFVFWIRRIAQSLYP